MHFFEWVLNGYYSHFVLYIEWVLNGYYHEYAVFNYKLTEYTKNLFQYMVSVPNIIIYNNSIANTCI
jgi:hypothetical protein